MFELLLSEQWGTGEHEVFLVFPRSLQTPAKPFAATHLILCRNLRLPPNQVNEDQLFARRLEPSAGRLRSNA